MQLTGRWMSWRWLVGWITGAAGTPWQRAVTLVLTPRTALSFLQMKPDRVRPVCEAVLDCAPFQYTVLINAPCEQPHDKPLRRIFVDALPQLGGVLGRVRGRVGVAVLECAFVSRILLQQLITERLEKRKSPFLPEIGFFV
jgi:hypothetical protein